MFGDRGDQLGLFRGERARHPGAGRDAARSAPREHARHRRGGERAAEEEGGAPQRLAPVDRVV
jgi:hypothetical protein